MLHLSGLTFDAISAEYTRASMKHTGWTPRNPDMSDGERLAILVEEVGEVARAMTYDEAEMEKLRDELIQVSAMSAAWAEYVMYLLDARRNGVHVEGNHFGPPGFTKGK